jgi:hypothetical protein
MPWKGAQMGELSKGCRCEETASALLVQANRAIVLLRARARARPPLPVQQAPPIGAAVEAAAIHTDS